MVQYININKLDLNLLQLIFKQRNTELLHVQDLGYKQLLNGININDKTLQHALEEDINYPFEFTSDSGKRTLSNLLALVAQEN